MASSESGDRHDGGNPCEDRKFWRELYWFAVISLAGVILALALVPPKAHRYWSLLELEARFAARHAELENRIDVLRAATRSMESDPVYREAAWRKVLGVKKKSEEFLKPDIPSVR